jgi:hypothetical protein
MKTNTIQLASTSASKKAHRGPSGLLKLYLISYNVASLAGWAYVLLLAVQQLIKSQDYKTVFDVTWPVLIVVQSTALFEVRIAKMKHC